MFTEQAPYGRRQKWESEAQGDFGRPNRISAEQETYYDLPALKASHYGWAIVTYLFIGGIAGAAQMIATIIDWVGGRQDQGVVRAGRYLAFLGSLASPVLLIADLHTPQRWYNMLRIFRRTSPMSIGAWLLTLFGTLSGLTLATQVLEDWAGWKMGRRLARLVAVPAALSGGALSLYTGVLLSATSTPLWAGAFPFLSSLFASSAAATATASLTLIAAITGAPRATWRRLERFALIAGIADLFFALLIDQKWRKQALAAPLQQQPMASAYRFGALGLGVIGPLLVHAVGLVRRRETRWLTVVAAIATLVGSFILRAVLIFAGNESARRPTDYFHATHAKSSPFWRGNGADGRPAR